MQNNVRALMLPKCLRFLLVDSFSPPSIPVLREVNMLIVYYDHIY